MPKEAVATASFQRMTVPPRSVVYVNGKKLRAGEQYLKLENEQLALCDSESALSRAMDAQDSSKHVKRVVTRLDNSQSPS